MFDAESPFPLPTTPADQTHLPVAAWAEDVTIPTYEPAPPDRFPAFLEKRVYQGSSGQVYPLPFVEAIALEATDHSWTALHLENEYVRLMILPELGGRVHIALDKSTGRDIFYRNDVIKPALVGLAGPWIAGGIEFNWPQHHRPGTYLPTDWEIERESDGSVTVWCSDHDPFARMKGTHGLRLRPGSSLIEARVRLHNRTELTQTFLWWANVAVSVHDDYQSFFPTDVRYVADHAKRAISTFPAATGSYYGVDYPARVDADHPDADRLDWYRNIPVPTSYMALGSDDDFFGGYDHAAGLGFVHVADHHIAPGKKQWTWGNAPFGWAWDRSLTDDNGPYVELMAGVYTNNQPDFSYLTPGETKAFSQYWFPLHDIGVAHQATTDAAIHFSENSPGSFTLGLAVTRPRVGLQVTITRGADVLWEATVDAAPGRSVIRAVELAGGTEGLTLTIRDEGVILAEYAPRGEATTNVEEPATELPAPESIESADELYLAGVHLAQYRHATRSPEPYWHELLRRDPLDSRANVALARRRIPAGELHEAEVLLRRAIERETRRNPNPASGEAFYLLGVVLARLGRSKDAAAALAKSAWNAAWRAPAHLALARLEAASGRWASCLEHAELAARFEDGNTQAGCIAVIALLELGRSAEADELLDRIRATDPLDQWARDLAGVPATTDPGVLVDLAQEYGSLGQRADAVRLLRRAVAEPIVEESGNLRPLIHYRLAILHGELDDPSSARAQLDLARTVDATRCFAGSAADADVLGRVLSADPTDARAHALLGHWLYFQRRHSDAEEHLQRAVELDPTDAVAWRGLGLGAFNVAGDPTAAELAYRRAVEAAPTDAKLLFESDQLARRRAVATGDRLATLEARAALLTERDDLTLSYAELLVDEGRADEAAALMLERRFRPWEGGEGQTLAIWTAAQRTIAASAVSAGRIEDALAALRSAIDPPQNLGEARHLLANFSDLLLDYGDALEANGERAGAERAWRSAASSAGDFTNMATVPYSTMTYYSSRAASRLGDEALAARLVEGVARYIGELRETTPSIDYFATSLPTMLIFDDDVVHERATLIDLLSAQLNLLRGEYDEAERVVTRVLTRDPANRLARALVTELSKEDLVDRH